MAHSYTVQLHCTSATSMYAHTHACTSHTHTHTHTHTYTYTHTHTHTHSHTYTYTHTHTHTHTHTGSSLRILHHCLSGEGPAGPLPPLPRPQTLPLQIRPQASNPAGHEQHLGSHHPRKQESGQLVCFEATGSRIFYFKKSRNFLKCVTKFDRKCGI